MSPQATFTLRSHRPRQPSFRPLWTKRNCRETTRRGCKHDRPWLLWMPEEMFQLFDIYIPDNTPAWKDTPRVLVPRSLSLLVGYRAYKT